MHVKFSPSLLFTLQQGKDIQRHWHNWHSHSAHSAHQGMVKAFLQTKEARRKVENGCTASDRHDRHDLPGHKSETSAWLGTEFLKYDTARVISCYFIRWFCRTNLHGLRLVKWFLDYLVGCVRRAQIHSHKKRGLTVTCEIVVTSHTTRGHAACCTTHPKAGCVNFT